MLVAVYFCTALRRSYHSILITLRSGLLTIGTQQLFFSYSIDLHAVSYYVTQFWPKFSCQMDSHLTLETFEMLSDCKLSRSCGYKTSPSHQPSITVFDSWCEVFLLLC